MLSLIGYQFDRVITEERRRLLGIVQGNYFTKKKIQNKIFIFFSLCLQIFV